MDYIRRLAQWLRAQHDLSHDEYHKVIHFWASKSSKDLQLYFMAYFGDEYDPTIEYFPILTREEVLAWVKSQWEEVVQAGKSLL